MGGNQKKQGKIVQCCIALKKVKSQGPLGKMWELSDTICHNHNNSVTIIIILIIQYV